MANLSNQTTEEFRTDGEALEAMGQSQAKPHPLDDPAVTRVSVTIAILAVAGVILGSVESLENAAAGEAGSQALIYQNRATDAWAALDARMVRQALGRPHSDLGHFAEKDEAALAAYAREQEQLSLASLAAVEARSDRHHMLTWAVMLVQIAIAIATISIIARPRRWPWVTSIALGAVGVATGLLGYML